MECPSCKRENPAGSRFCLGCGSELSQSCPACGQGLPPDAAFCNACGHSLAQEAPEPEQPVAVPSPTSLASGRYRVQRFLGEGAKKRVYLARGRDVELKGLEGTHRVFQGGMDRAVSGQGNIAMLVGEPGSGKTRTSMELETYARMRGSHVLVGRSHESEGMPSYWPWIEVGRAYGSNHDIAALNLHPGIGQELVRIFPELNVEASPAQDDPDAAQFRLFDAYTTFIRAITEQKPLLIVLDDLHWADKPSLHLLQHLARSLPRMRLLVVGTYRDTDLVRTHPLSEALASLNREAGFDRIVLRGLSRAEVGSYIRTAAHIEPPPALVERIHDETEGNPFFLSEVVNLMAQEGTLTASASSEIALPDGVKEALGRRLDRLSAEANELLQVAAVAGREFRHETLALLGDRSEDELFELLEEGLAARVIEETGAAGQYRFTHALMQETLLDELSTTRRVRLHGRIGEALEQRWGERADERATRLAQHFVEAATLTERHAEKAMRYSRLAAERAEMQAGWGEAARRYTDCLTLLTETEAALEGNEAELLVKLGICHRNAGAAREAWRSLFRATDLFREQGNGVGMARAAYEAAPINAPPERQAKVLVEAIEQLGDADPYLEARLHATLLHPKFGRFDIDSNLHRELATELADRHNLADVRANLLIAKADDMFEAGRREEALELELEAHRAFDSPGLVREAAEVIYQTTLNSHSLGSLGQIKSLSEEGLAYARRYHLRYFEENSAAILADKLLVMADYESLDALLEEQAGAATFMTRVVRSERELLRGNVEAAREALPTAEVVRGIKSQSQWIHAIRARVFAAARNMDLARQEFSRILQLGEPNYHALGILHEFLFQLADPDLLRKWFEVDRQEGRSSRGHWSSQFVACPGAVSPREFWGRLALAMGEEAEAEDAFRTTLEWAEREGAPVIAGLCHESLAQLASRRIRSAEAHEHLDIAAGLFQQHEAKLHLDRVIARKLELQGASASGLQTSIAAVATSVSRGRPDLTLHAAPDGSVTLVFSDMEDYTGMLERLGDLGAHQLVQSHNAIVREHTAAHGGHEVELRGDGFLLAFGSAQRAVQCAYRTAACHGRVQRGAYRAAAPHPRRPAHRRGDQGRGQVLRQERRPGLPHRRPRSRERDPRIFPDPRSGRERGRHPLRRGTRRRAEGPRGNPPRIRGPLGLGSCAARPAASRIRTG